MRSDDSTGMNLDDADYERARHLRDRGVAALWSGAGITRAAGHRMQEGFLVTLIWREGSVRRHNRAGRGRRSKLRLYEMILESL
jgi:hypothetical protein